MIRFYVMDGYTKRYVTDFTSSFDLGIERGDAGNFIKFGWTTDKNKADKFPDNESSLILNQLKKEVVEDPHFIVRYEFDNGTERYITNVEPFGDGTYYKENARKFKTKEEATCTIGKWAQYNSRRNFKIIEVN